MKTKTRPRNKGYVRDKNNFNEGVKLWASYYRCNIHRFCIDYFGLNLFPFQMMVLYMMNKSTIAMTIASRGIGKSYLLAIFCCAKAVLLPQSKIILASGTKGQSKLLISQKIEKELMVASPNLRREISSIQVGQNMALVKFRNGLTIEAVASTDNSRGYRGTILVLDESRLISKHVLDSVLRPFLTVTRQPKFMTKKEYKDYPREENSELYISSAWYKDHYMYDKFLSIVKGMCKGKSMFACNFSYLLAMNHGLLTPNRVENMRTEEDFDDITWSMEMEGLFYGKFFA